MFEELLANLNNQSLEKVKNKRVEQAKKEILRCAPIFAQLLDGEGAPVKAAFKLQVEKLEKYRDSIAHLIAVKRMRKGDDYNQHNLRIAELQGAYEALGYAIGLPKSYFDKMNELRNKESGK